MANVELKRLRMAAKDINSAIDLETDIPVDVDDDEIADALIAEGNCDAGGFYEDDEFKKDTFNVLAELEIVLKPAQVDSGTATEEMDEDLPPEEPEEETAEEAETAEEEETAEEAEAEAEETIKPKKGKKAMKKKASAKKARVKKTRAKKTKAKKTSRYSRECSVVDAIEKQMQTLEVIADKANKLYSANGGSDNVQQSMHVLKIGLKFLMHAGVTKQDAEGRAAMALSDTYPFAASWG